MVNSIKEYIIQQEKSELCFKILWLKNLVGLKKHGNWVVMEWIGEKCKRVEENVTEAEIQV